MYVSIFWCDFWSNLKLELGWYREVRLMVDTQIACLTEEVLPALKKNGFNLVDYEELHLHEKDQVIPLNVYIF